MIIYKMVYITLVVTFTAIQHHTAAQVEDQSQLLENYLHTIRNEIKRLEQNSAALKKKLMEEEAVCWKITSSLTQEFTAANGNVKIGNYRLQASLKKIQEEEKKHSRLRAELKLLYDEIEVGTQTLQRLHEDLKHKINSVPHWGIKPRSLTKQRTTHKGRNIVLLKQKIRLAELLRDKQKGLNRELLAKKAGNTEICMQLLPNLKQLIHKARDAVQFLDQSQNLLDTRIRVVLSLTESMTVEIDYGYKLLEGLKKGVATAKTKIEEVERDNCC